MAEQLLSAPVAEWLTVKEAAARAKCSTRLIYENIQRGRLRASRLGTRNDIRILETWLMAWLVSLSTPTVINPDAPEHVGDAQPTTTIPFTRRGPKP
jgi:excisionase family DNA binding protein